MDNYIADLRAVIQMDLNLKVFRMARLGIPQQRSVKRLGVPQANISRYLSKMPKLAKWINSDLNQGFTVPQVAEKHGWPGCEYTWRENMLKFIRLKGFRDVRCFTLVY